MDREKELEKIILHHRAMYYAGKPEISDESYDQLENELRIISPNNYVLHLVGSTLEANTKIKHEKKMLSLEKTYDVNDLVKWMGDEEIILTYKIDGMSCSLVYENGKLTVAKTRGDGSFGENIFDKVQFINSIPRDISIKYAEVRGEIYCTETNFLHLSEEMRLRGLEAPTSLRNIVAGVMGRKEHIDLSSYFEFRSFDLLSDELSLIAEEDKFKTLQKENFHTPPHFKVANVEMLNQQISDFKKFIENGEYLVDGIVLTYNRLMLHLELGETNHHPRYKIAFKFQGETANSLIKEIKWQISRNGVLTPVAEIEPVILSGAKINRLSLHNFGIVKDFNLKTGDTIEIVRSGEVIPKFISVNNSIDGTYTYPQTCPSCRTVLRIDDIRLICENRGCPERLKEEILSFIQKIGIEDFSIKRLEDAMEKGIVTKIADLYKNNSTENWLKLDKSKEKLASKIFEQIEKSKNPSVLNFFSALGISGAAGGKIEKIINHGFDTVDKITHITFDQLVSIEGFAEKSAKEFIDSLGEKKEVIKELLTLGVTPKIEVRRDSAIKGMKFCITGSLTRKRDQVEKDIKHNGGIVVASVSKETDYLVTNEESSSSSKWVKAKSLGTKIITEENLYNLME